jgi:hypothetical protein
MSTKQPTASAISALLRRSGFTRSTWGGKGVMYSDAATGYTAWKTHHKDAPQQPYVAVQHHIKDDGTDDWPERKHEMLAQLEKYAQVLRLHGYHAMVRRRGDEPPWLIIMTAVTAPPSGEATGTKGKERDR